ncbi:MAG: agmatinase [Rhodospirillales bacterium]|nr:agmatinase [Rhodospirillales bacterium]
MRRVVDALGDRVTLHRGDHQVYARCPVPGHDDQNPSLSVTWKLARDGGGRTFVRCQRSCSAAEVVAALGLVDCGNVRLTPSKIEDAFARTEQAVDRIVAASAIPITIGGDGSVTVPVARAVGKKHGKMAALHIDAHTDAYPYDATEKYNSATQFTHVAEEGLVDPAFSWHVGIRGTTYAQGVVPRAMSLGYKVVTLDELVRGGFAQRMAEFRDKVGKRPVYLCFDMDVFDPSVAPGVCTPTWGGLSAREGIDLLRCLNDLNIVAVDVNTVSPPQDVNGMAAHLCAHVIYETLVLLCRQMGLAAAK